MLLALFSDIHANRQAFSACLEAARGRGAQRIVFLGDFVGYGGDPEWTVDTAIRLIADGAVAVRGNHDEAIATTSETMNAQAQVAIEWTRDRLSAPQRRFLAELPLSLQEEDRLYVHSEASAPSHWNYVQSATDAARSLIATPAHVTFCGHFHRPALYSMSTTAKMTSFVPTSGVPIQLLRGRRSVSRAMAIPRRPLPCTTPNRAKSPIVACLTTSRRRRGGSGRTACRPGSQIALLRGGEGGATCHPDRI